MQFTGRFKFNIFLAFCVIVQFAAFCNAQNAKLSDIDNIRAELACYKNKNSQEYIKARQKLAKLIIQNKLDYSAQSRLSDVQRLIGEKKYNSAIYELNDLIENNFEVGKCYEILGDIYLKSYQNIKTAAGYYRSAANSGNICAFVKLAKLYLIEQKNIIGIEYLKQIVESTNDKAILEDIENFIQNKANPTSRLEANNFYEILGLIYIKLNRKEESYTAFDKALRLNPEDLYLQYYFGDVLFTNDQNNGALTVYDSILKDNPFESQIRTSKAKTLIKDGNLLSANKEYLKILEQYPQSNQAKYGIFKIYENKLSADKILEKIHANDPNYKATKEECIKFSNFLKELEDYNGAQIFDDYVAQLDFEEELKKAKQKELERQKQIAQQKAKQQAQKQQEAKKQKDLSKNIKKTNPQPSQKNKPAQKPVVKQISKPAQKQVSKSAEKPAQKQVAKQVQKPAQKQVSKPVQKTNPKQTGKPIQKQVSKPTQKTVQKQTSKHVEKYQEYQKIVENYLNIENKDAATYVAIANTYKLMQEPQNSLKYYLEALKLNPKDSDIHYNIGLTYFELNETKLAKKYLLDAINLNKDNLKAINLLSFVNQKIVTQIINNAYNKFENKQFLDAFEILNKGINEYPSNAQMYYYRALVCDALGRNAAQIIDLQKSIELDPGYYMSYYQLGLAYEKIKDERSALVAYERFLSAEPDEKELIKEVQKKVLTLGAKYY